MPYVAEKADLTMLCLAIIAPVGPGNEAFEAVLDCVRQRKKCPQLDRWTQGFLNGDRPKERIRNWQWSWFKEQTYRELYDSHFIKEMFKSFGRQCDATMHRIGHLDCNELSVHPSGSIAPQMRQRRSANPLKARLGRLLEKELYFT